MRQINGVLAIALVIIVAVMAVKAGFVIAAPPTPDEIKNGTDAIGKFLKCINDEIDAKKGTGGIKISDTVMCLPGSCTPTITLTMSDKSAQEACFLGGENGTGTCQLPRVIVKCPGPPQIEFSYLLCGKGSAGADDVVGGNRVEVGVAVGDGTMMVMADIPVPPNTIKNIENVISVGTPTAAGTTTVNGDGSKGCNAGCHGPGAVEAAVGDTQLSTRIEVFGTSGAPATARNPSFIIDTDDEQVKEKTKDLPMGNLKGVRVIKQTLSEVCECIDNAPIGGAVTAEVKALCEALKSYQKRGGNHPTPSPSGTPTPKPSPTESPTVVTLSSFSVDAVGEDGSMLVQWETASEIDNAGFNLYRSKTKNGRYRKINDTLIPAQGNAVYGASYSFVDTPKADGTYYYKLEAVDFYGLSTLHEPVKVRTRRGIDESRRQ